jgi:CRISPR/Cas system-associated exonuclease Cas4 (RecB family)
MKTCFDANRPKLPVNVANRLPPGRTLWGNKDQINKLRNWRSGLKVELKIQGKTVSLIGALDDLIVEPDETFSPFDVKTKGKQPETDGAEYYQHQMDLYALMLIENKMTPSGKAYLDYWFPTTFTDSGDMGWGSRLFELAVSPARGVEWLEKAVTIMTAGAAPASNPKCEYCNYFNRRVANGK